MKILVANPNSSEELTEILMESARSKVTNPNTKLIPLTNPKGSKHIDSTFGDYQSIWSFVRAVIVEVERDEYDAVVIAGFGNFGVFALKEALDIPVVSVSEASETLASMMGHRFSVLTVLKQNIPYQEDLVRMYHLESKCASVRGINVTISNYGDEEEVLMNLKSEIDMIVQEDGADVVVLGGARFGRYAERLQEICGLPVIDPVEVSVKLAEMMVETGLSHSKKGKFAHPPQRLHDYFVPEIL